MICKNHGFQISTDIRSVDIYTEYYAQMFRVSGIMRNGDKFILFIFEEQRGI